MLKGFVNGRIYVSFNPLVVVDGILVMNSRVLYVGSSSKIIDYVNLVGGEIIDLNGKTMLPGFIDAHIHMDSLGLHLSTLDLRGVKSIKELKRRLVDYIERYKPGVVIGRGWDQELFEEKRYPTRLDLDEVAKDVPTMLTRVCGHMAVLNTIGLEYTGLIQGQDKYVLKDKSGDLTGIVVEEAVSEAYRKFTESLSQRDIEGFLRRAQEYLLANGITTVGFVSCDLKSLKALFEMHTMGELRVRVRIYLTPDQDGSGIVRKLIDLGVKAGLGDDYLRIMGVKLFIDGSLGARTAWLSEPYYDSPDNTGQPIIDREELLNIAKLVDESGLQLAIHAIGDKAIELALEVLSELRYTKKHRHRIEHVSVLRDDLLEQLKKTGAVAVVQPRFIISDWWAKSRLGPGRIKWLYRFKTMIENGVPVAFSTDAPVEPVNPWESIYSAVTRGRYEGIPYYDDTKHERLNVVSSLYCYTMGSSYALLGEGETGALLPGMYADFIIIDKDPLSIEEKELRDISILETYVGGKRVFQSKNTLIGTKGS